MRTALARHLASFVLPLTAALIVPAALLGGEGWEQLGNRTTPALLAVGAVLGLAGLAMLTWTVTLFVRIGRGTLAPWSPTRALVVRGPYAHVRNPMISGVACILLGEAVACASPPVAAWAALFVLTNHVYFVLSEEPGLLERFGAAYEVYRRNVPRWIPRRLPWRAERCTTGQQG
jgi:protein-S-isoprenylcysteine O-methyltransferase Ste14